MRNLKPLVGKIHELSLHLFSRGLINDNIRIIGFSCLTAYSFPIKIRHFFYLEHSHVFNSYRETGTTGLEPVTVRLEGGCSIQLSYVPIKI